MKEKHRIFTILGLLSTFVLIAPNIILAKESMGIVFVAILILIIGLSAIKRHWVDAGIALTVGAFFGISALIYQPTESFTFLFRNAGILAFIFLNLALWIGPVVRFFPKLSPIYKHRRHFGVVTFFLAWMHGSFILHEYFDYSLTSAFGVPFTFFGVTAMFILLLLAITSWDKIQKLNSKKHWIIAHSVALFIYGILAYDFIRITEGILSGPQKSLVFVIAIFWAVVNPFIFLKIRPKSRFNGWKQLHMLVYIGFASVVIHVALGPLVSAPKWMQIGFWILAALTIALQTIGMISGIIKSNKKKDMRPNINHEGKKYYLLDYADRFKEDNGERFSINGIDIAAFRHKGKVFAISNVCPHQGAPLCDGAIKDGYVVCPWHQWQFSVEDGTAPPDHDDSVPYFHVIERDGKIYINLDSKNAA